MDSSYEIKILKRRVNNQSQIDVYEALLQYRRILDWVEDWSDHIDLYFKLENIMGSKEPEPLNSLIYKIKDIDSIINDHVNELSISRLLDDLKF
jgi:hypothetical protein